MKEFRSIVITGASSGIGKALALAYAGPGVRLALTGRDAARLAEVVNACTAAGAHVDHQILDVTHREPLAAWLEAIDGVHPVDLIIANAGVSMQKSAESAADESLTRHAFAVNVEGVFNTVFPLLPAMRRRHAGHIALMSSLAGFVGMPPSAGYNASKAALRVWGESLRPVLRADGVGLSVICPGFVDTPMNALDGSARPLVMSATRAAAIIRHGLARDRARIAFPLAARAAIWAGSLLPGYLLDQVVKRSAD